MVMWVRIIQPPDGFGAQNSETVALAMFPKSQMSTKRTISFSAEETSSFESSNMRTERGRIFLKWIP